MAHAKYTDILAERRAHIVAQLASFIYEAEHSGFGLEELVRDVRQRCEQLYEEELKCDLLDEQDRRY